MKTFSLTDTAFADLAAGRPSPETIGVLRRAQASRHLLRLSEIRKLGAPLPPKLDLYDPMAALHTSATRKALRAGAPPPPPRTAASRHLTATHEDLTLRVRLEDTDPLRSHLGLPPSAPLTPREAAAWQHLLSEAWYLLTTRHRPAAEVLAAVLQVIVPVEPDPGSGGLSATSAAAFGAVAISTPPDPRALAVGLLHETQHSLLNATATLFDLLTPGASRIYYSPWRDDPRPLAGLLHGAYAYLSVTRFWRTEFATRVPARWQGRETLLPRGRPAENSSDHPPAADATARSSPADPDKSVLNTKGAGPRGSAAGGGGLAGLRGRLAEFEFARWRAAVGQAADLLLGSGHLTAPGARFVRAVRDEVGGWLGEAVDARVERLAVGANAEHRARWRLRNVAVREDVVAGLVAAWRDGVAAPLVAEEGGELRDGAGRRLASGERLSVVHRLLREGDQLLREGDQRGRAGAGLRPGDRAYLDGDAGAALAAYTREVERGGRDSRDLDLWAGMAVVSPHVAMRERPELVRAVWLAVWPAGGKVGPDAVARWLGGSLMSIRP